MKKLFVPAILLLLLNINFCAQKIEVKPDFSGTWILDKTNSVVEVGILNDQLDISDADPELKITQKGLFNGIRKTADLIFYTDKRGEKNKQYLAAEKVEITSKTTRKRHSIIRTIAAEGNLITNGRRRTIVENYFLSKDNKTLVLKIVTSTLVNFPTQYGGPYFERVNQKLIYKRL